jgi:hypothetical protein
LHNRAIQLNVLWASDEISDQIKRAFLTTPLNNNPLPFVNKIGFLLIFQLVSVAQGILGTNSKYYG